MMELKYPIVLEDHLDAHQASLEYNFSRPWVRWGLLRILPIFLIVSSLYFFLSDYSYLSDLDLVVLQVFSYLNLLGGVLLPFLLRPKVIASSPFRRRERDRAWQNTPIMREARTITATENGLTIKGETWETFWKWNACHYFFETEQGFLIRFFSGESRFFPKRIFNSEAQIYEFRQLLKNRS
jgi:hypothetical protein